MDQIAFLCDERRYAFLGNRTIEPSGRLLTSIVAYATDPQLKADAVAPGSIIENLLGRVCGSSFATTQQTSSVLDGRRISQVHWTEVGFTQNRTYVIRMALDSIRHEGSNSVAIVLTESAKDETSPNGRPIRYRVGRIHFDCPNRQFKSSKVDMYDVRFNAVDWLDVDPRALNWETVNSGSVLEGAMKVACDASPASAQARKPDSTADAKPKSTPNANARSIGTGWVTDKGYVITAHHVVAGRKRIVVLDNKKQVFAARIESQDASNDVAILSVEFRGTPPRGLGIAKSPAGLGTRVFTIGYPHVQVMGVSQKLTSGEVSALSGMRDDPRHLQISVPVQSGNSGGALVNLQGEVVGLVSAKLEADKVLAATGDLPQNVNYAVKAVYLDVVHSQLPAKRGAAKLATSTTAQSLEQVAERVQDAVLLVFADDGE